MIRKSLGGVKRFIEQDNVRINENKFKLSKFVLFSLLIILVIIVLSGTVSAAVSPVKLANTPQPKFHHDNSNTGQSQYKGPQTNSTKWKYTTKSWIQSSPAIGTDGTIYFGSDDNKLYALNPTGTQKWNFTPGSFTTPGPISDQTEQGITRYTSEAMITNYML